MIFQRDHDSFFELVENDSDLLNRPIWSNQGVTPMHLLANTGDVEGLGRAVDLGGDLHATDEHGRSVFHFAFGGYLCRNRYPSQKLVSLLLEHGCDPNIQSRWGDTPLHRATSWAPRWSPTFSNRVLTQAL